MFHVVILGVWGVIQFPVTVALRVDDWVAAVRCCSPVVILGADSGWVSVLHYKVIIRYKVKVQTLTYIYCAPVPWLYNRLSQCFALFPVPRSKGLATT